MTERERTELLLSIAESHLTQPSSNLGPLIGWADAMIELQLLDEMEGVSSY